MNEPEDDVVANREQEEVESLTVLTDSLAPENAPRNVRARLLDTVASTRRFARFAGQVASLLDLDNEAAQQLLEGIDRTSSWEPGFAKHIHLYHVEGGPDVRKAITGFVRLPGGTAFPEHRHLGREAVLVIQGRMIDHDGREFGPGQIIRQEAGTTHAFEAVEGPDLVYLAVVHDGVEISGEVLRADDPRA